MMMASARLGGTYLDRILENTGSELEQRKRFRPLAHVEEAARSRPAPIPFAPALRQQYVSVIAEIKRASPSKGSIAPGVDAVEVARDYIDGGAAAISVLTDEVFFGGSLDDLSAVAAVASQHATPVLRKDFVLDAYQLAEARAAGASAVLLIVATLSDGHLRELLATAAHYGVEPLVEVHDEGELERALTAGATTIGINNRDLRTFNVDLATTERVAALIPDACDGGWREWDPNP
jgi:indole-3-glycerol phosphate synthase